MFEFVNKIKTKNSESKLEEINQKISKANNELKSVLSEIEKKKEELGILDGVLEIQDLGIMYTPNITGFDDIKQKQAELEKKTW